MGNEASRARDARIEELDITVAKNAEEISSLTESFERVKETSARAMDDLRGELEELQDGQRELKSDQANFDHQVGNLSIDVKSLVGKLEQLQEKFERLSQDHERSMNLQPKLIHESIAKEADRLKFSSDDLNRKYTEMKSYFTELIDSCKNNNDEIEELAEKFAKLQSNDSGVIMPCRCRDSNYNSNLYSTESSPETLIDHDTPSCYDANLIKIKRAIRVMKEQIRVDEDFDKTDSSNDSTGKVDLYLKE